MRQVFRFDSEGFYVEPVMLENGESTPIDCTSTPIEKSFYKARFVSGEWVEGLAQTEIEAINNVPSELAPLETLTKDQADLMLQLVMKGVL